MATERSKKIISTSKTTNPKVIKHFCVQEDKIIEMHKVVTGNSHPEEGLQFQVLLLNKNNEHINSTLKDIKDTLLEINKKYDSTINIATTAMHAVDAFKKEEIAFDEGEKQEKIRIHKIKVDKRAAKGMWITLAAVMITLLLGVNGARESYLGRIQREDQLIQMDSTNVKIDELSTKIDTNTKMIKRNTLIVDKLDALHR